MTEKQKGLLAGLGIGIVVTVIFCAVNATAHPCNDGYVEQQPTCKYVQVVNPVTGKLEQQYVCT